MSSVSQMAEVLQELLEGRARQLARETGLIQRQRNFDGADLAQSLIFGWLQEPAITLEGLCQVLGRRQVKLSASGLAQRFSQESAAFFERLLSELSCQHVQAVAQVPLAILAPFSAVWLEDSSTVSLPGALRESWKGCGDSRGERAAVKLCTRWEIKRGQVQGPMLMEGRRNDKRSPLALESLPRGSLYIADLGYFSLKRLARLCGRGGHLRRRAVRYFLSRYQRPTALLSRQGQALDLRALVPKRVGERKQCLALLGQQERLPVRLLLERVPKEVGEQRREQVRQRAADHGHQADAFTLWLCDWTILVTNVPARLLSFEQVLVLMHVRWQMERLFRLWKEDGLIDEWRSHKPWRILTELYAKLCAMLIQHWFILAGCWQDAHRSLVKAAQVVRREAGSVMLALAHGGLEHAIALVLGCMQSGCRLDKRQQFPSTAQLLEGACLPAQRPRPACRRRHRDQVQRWPAGKGWAVSFSSRLHHRRRGP